MTADLFRWRRRGDAGATGRRGRSRGLGAQTVALAVAASVFGLGGCPAKPPQEPTPKPPPKASTADTETEAEAARRAAEAALPKVNPKAPVDRAELRTPWARAQAGDWALYRVPTGELRVEVTATTTAGLIVRRGADEEEVSLAVDERDYVLHRDPGNLDPAAYSIDGGLREVGGREIECLVVRRRGGGEVEETWYSDELSLEDGVVLKKRGAQVVLELKAFGSAAPR